MQAFLAFSTISLFHRAENKQNSTVCNARRSLPYVGHHGLHAIVASGLHTCHFITLGGWACMGNLGMCGKDISRLKGAGGVFFPLGTLNKLFVVHLCFDCDLSHEVRCGLSHLWHRVGVQKVSDFGAFRVSDIQIRDTHPVLLFCRKCIRSVGGRIKEGRCGSKRGSLGMIKKSLKCDQGLLWSPPNSLFFMVLGQPSKLTTLVQLI